MLRVDERVERLEQPPDRRRSRPGGRRADTARYLHSLSLGADGATLGGVPEGDSLHRAARRLRVLVGERLEVEAPHPRGQLTGVAEQLDGRRLESVEAVGKNLLLRFEGGLVLRSHLRMKGRWWVRPRGSQQLGRPWLVLRGSEHEAIQMNGPVLELQSDVRRRLGPDILAQPPEFDGMLGNLRAAPQGLPLGEALQRQRLVAGVGNMWMTAALWSARGARARRPAPPTGARAVRAHRAEETALRHGGGARDAARASPLRRPPPLLPRRLSPTRAGGGDRCRGPLRVRGARRPRQAVLLRVPTARARVRRGTRVAARGRGGRGDRGRGARA